MTDNAPTRSQSPGFGWYLLVMGVFFGGVGLLILSVATAYLAFGLGPEMLESIYTLADALEGIER